MTLDWLAETRAAAIDIPQHRLRTIGSAPPSAIWTARCSSVTSGLEVPRQLSSPHSFFAVAFSFAVAAFSISSIAIAE